jgi:hypothetical protein
MDSVSMQQCIPHKTLCYKRLGGLSSVAAALKSQCMCCSSPAAALCKPARGLEERGAVG